MKYLVHQRRARQSRGARSDAGQGRRRTTRVLVLGDLVGYGADPNAVIERIRQLPAATIIRGNHDKVGAGIENVEAFNHLAKHAITWTAAALTPGNRAWLAALPAGPVNIDSWVEICHGAPFDEDVYIFDDLDARRALLMPERPLCLFGHTHVPAVYKFDTDFHPVGPPRGRDVPPAAGRCGEVSGQLRRRGPAARRRSARGVRDARHRRAGR